MKRPRFKAAYEQREIVCSSSSLERWKRAERRAVLGVKWAVKMQKLLRGGSEWAEGRS